MKCTSEMLSFRQFTHRCSSSSWHVVPYVYTRARDLAHLPIVKILKRRCSYYVACNSCEFQASCLIIFPICRLELSEQILSKTRPFGIARGRSDTPELRRAGSGLKATPALTCHVTNGSKDLSQNHLRQNPDF